MKSIELFAGIGGITLAAEWAGIETIALCEREPFCQKVLRKHWPETPVFDDVKTLSKQLLIDKGVIKPDETIDIISGGYPCQPFSLAGKQGGDQDERYLWDEYFRLVQELRPNWVIGENVFGHVNNGLSKVISDLESIGYETEAIVLPAEAIGAPHKRERVFIVGHTNRQSKLQENTASGTFRSQWQAWQSLTWEYWRTFSKLHWSVPKPGICRMDDGFSRELDKSRLIALGNAVVPQQIYPIFKMIKDMEERYEPIKPNQPNS